MATPGGPDRGSALEISIHATLAGGDAAQLNEEGHRTTFLSTPPSRVATEIVFPSASNPVDFYPRHPRGWRQVEGQAVDVIKLISIHATLAGGDG